MNFGFSGDNFSSQTRAAFTDVGGYIDLKMPVVSTPGRRPGSMGLVGGSVHVRLSDQSVLILGGAGSAPTWAQVIAQGNSSGGDIVVNGALLMNAVQPTPNDPTDVLTLSSTGVAPVGTSAAPGSLVYNSANGTLYLRSTGSWVPLDTSSSQNWSSVLTTGASSGGTNPVISNTDQIQFDLGIRLGHTGNLAGNTAGSSISIGGGATAQGAFSIAIGSNASAPILNSVAIGPGAVAATQNTIQMGSSTMDTVFGRYIATSITEGGRISGTGGPSGIGSSSGVFSTLPIPYSTVEYNNVRPGSDFTSYVAAGSVLVTVPRGARVIVNSLVYGGFSSPVGVGYMRSKLVWSDDGTDKSITENVIPIGILTDTWVLSNQAAFTAGTGGTSTSQTVRLLISNDGTGQTFFPVSYFIEVIRIS